LGTGDMTDRELVASIAAGNAEAFAAFYDRHAPRVFGLICRLVRQPAVAEDVLQETFWQVWRIADRYDPSRSSPEVWVLLLARSRALDCLRRQRVFSEISVEPETLENCDPAQAVEQSEAGQQVREALEQLPAEQRLAIRLAFFAGLTHEQVARQVGVSLGTAKTRIRLGMKRLSKLLRESSDWATEEVSS
jgi:RNA polymerase sigma-70 factor, ECF subfamily